MSKAASSETDWYLVWHRLTLVSGRVVLFPVIWVLIIGSVSVVLQYPLPGWVKILIHVFLLLALLEWTSPLVDRLLPGWLPTYLYVRVSLRTPITRAEAKKVSFLFDGSLNRVRYSIWDLRDVEAGRRIETLKSIANQYADRYGLFRPFGSFKERFAYYQANKKEPQDSTPPPHSPKPEPVFEVPDREGIDEALRTLDLYTKPKSFDEIKRAYRRKISEYHPDKFVGAKAEVIRCANEIAKSINTAYGHLEQACQGR